VQAHKIFRGGRPGWKYDVTHRGAILKVPQGKSVFIPEAGWRGKQLRDALFDVTETVGAPFPDLGQGKKNPVRYVKLTPLKLHSQGGEGLAAQKEKEHHGRGGVVRTV